MAEPESTFSSKPANITSALIFIIGIGIFAYIGVQSWLPFLLLNAGIAIILRNVMLGEHFDSLVSLVVFGGAFISSLLGFFGVIFVPALFMLGGFYFILRQFITFKRKSMKDALPSIALVTEEETKEEELKNEIKKQNQDLKNSIKKEE